jgi:hypothetical protein
VAIAIARATVIIILMLFIVPYFDTAKLQRFFYIALSQKTSIFSYFAQKLAVTMESSRIFAP